jgi:hypothetical protein
MNRKPLLMLAAVGLVIGAATRASADSVGYVAPATSSNTTVVRNTSTTTTVVNDETSVEAREERSRLESGVGLEIIGVAGTTNESRLGVGGRLEYVTPFGLTLGGSFTQHFNTAGGDAEKSAVRPLLAEVGLALPIAPRVELRPMVGVGYAFVNTQSSGTDTASGRAASASIAASGFDVAPGAKLSFGGRGLQVYTMPKYHFINDMSFAAFEVGAGLRF